MDVYFFWQSKTRVHYNSDHPEFNQELNVQFKVSFILICVVSLSVCLSLNSLRALEWPQRGITTHLFLLFDMLGNVEATAHLWSHLAGYSPKHLDLLYEIELCFHGLRTGHNYFLCFLFSSHDRVTWSSDRFATTLESGCSTQMSSLLKLRSFLCGYFVYRLTN